MQKIETSFDKSKWKTKKGKDYPHRKAMLNDILYNDDFRKLKEGEILQLLGDPDRTNENFLYYQITQTRLVFWPLHTRTMVVKLKDDGTVEWIKVNE